MIEVGAIYSYANSYSYFISKSNAVQLDIPPLSINADFKYYIDFSMASHHRDLNGENARILKELYHKKRLSSFYIGAGPAFSFIIGKSSYNRKSRPYLDDYKITSIFPDLSIGYFQYKLNAAANISWRFYTMSLAAHSIHQEVKRASVALEMYKFFGDYHGFVPFAGIIVSIELLKAKELANGSEVFYQNCNMITGGIIAGWDIRPTRTDWWG